jgi:hypothetical protein
MEFVQGHIRKLIVAQGIGQLLGIVSIDKGCEEKEREQTNVNGMSDEHS